MDLIECMATATSRPRLKWRTSDGLTVESSEEGSERTSGTRESRSIPFKGWAKMSVFSNFKGVPHKKVNQSQWQKAADMMVSKISRSRREVIRAHDRACTRLTRHSTWT